MLNNKKETGNYGETVANGFLQKKGYEILETQFRCIYGEIDIIAKGFGVVVFVEVKYRKGNKTGFGRESVTLSKQRKIHETALYYIAENNLTQIDFRFDVIEIFGKEMLTIEHLENAFSLSSYANG